MIMETIISRIKKLLALTVERGATPEEAATALAKAQALLFEHNLTMSAVESHGKTTTETIGNLAHKVSGHNGSIKWRKTLYNVIAKKNFCAVIGDTSGDGRGLWIIGKATNVAVVIIMAESIGNQIHNMALIARRIVPGGLSGSFYTTFCHAAIHVIGERLQKQQDEQAAANTSCTALVVQSRGEIQAATAKFFPKVNKARATRLSSNIGWEEGRKAGHRVQIHAALK
jgi:hypothetical protein